MISTSISFASADLTASNATAAGSEPCLDATVRIFGNEQIYPFPPVKAKYVKFDVLSTVGTDSYEKKYSHGNVCIGNLTLFGKK